MARLFDENDPCDAVALHIARRDWAGLQACGCPRVPELCRCYTEAHYSNLRGGASHGKAKRRHLHLDELDQLQHQGD